MKNSFWSTIVAGFEKCSFNKNAFEILHAEADRPDRFHTTAVWIGEKFLLVNQLNSVFM